MEWSERTAPFGTTIAFLAGRLGDVVVAYEIVTEEKTMLVLSRKVGERIQIGRDVVLTITAIKGNRIQLGIDAPPEVLIRRGELLEFSSLDADPAASHARATAHEKQVA